MYRTRGRRVMSSSLIPLKTCRAESVSETDEIGNFIEEIVDLAKQVNLGCSRTAEFPQSGADMYNSLTPLENKFRIGQFPHASVVVISTETEGGLIAEDYTPPNRRAPARPISVKIQSILPYVVESMVDILMESSVTQSSSNGFSSYCRMPGRVNDGESLLATLLIQTWPRLGVRNSHWDVLSLHNI
ncbi:hypothetical protein TNCV_2214151 [Trichonephila clavipes]|nr:hypothetical protein TNCV_2214151 [Trichonephila clavipes]